MDAALATAEHPTRMYFRPYMARSPYFRATLRAGAKAFEIYNHRLIPVEFGDPIEEYWHLVNHVTLWDVGVEQVVEIAGPDAFELTNLLTPRDLTKCAIGQGKYVVNTAEDGGIVNDPVLLRLEEDRFWLCPSDSDLDLWARGMAVGRRMNVRVHKPEVFPVQVQGPKSRDVLRDLVGSAIDRVRYYWTLQTDVDGIPVVVSRTGWSAEMGFEIYLTDPSRGEDLWNRILEAGRPHDIRTIAASEIRRVEAGILNYRGDMTIENNPFEVSGLERQVDEQEADYIGKAALERIREEGVRRKLVGVEVEGDPYAELADFALVFAGGERVGHVTTLIWSPRLERNVGYVWVPIELAEPGSEIEVELEGHREKARTARLPFVDPEKRIPAA